MEKGRSFETFDQFESALKEFCSENNVLFVKRSTEGMKDPQLKHLRYETVVFVCKHGVSKHASQCSGERPCQRSLKLGCPAKLRLKTMRPPNATPHLMITVSCMNHQGHDMTTEAASLLPENRRIEVQERAKLLLSCTSLKSSELRARLEEDNQVVLMTHDVYNLKRKVCGRGSDSEECGKQAEAIQTGGGVVSLGHGEDGELEYLFFMTKSMRQILNLYPEVVILDVTYKTNLYLYPLLTAMVLDGEGHGVPVMHSFLKREDRASMELCLGLFAQQCTSPVKCFVVDKDLAEITALQAVFPETPVNLCSFHIHQAVKRFLKKELPSESVETVVDMFMSMVYTESEEEFNTIKCRISEIVPQSVLGYFQNHWWGKVGLWAACFNMDVVRLHATTTNHLESYHGKIKKLLNEKLTLSSSLRELVSFDNIKIADCRRKLLIKTNSVSYDQRDSDETSRTITMCLTRFAADMTKGQLSCARKTCYEVSFLHDSMYSVAYREKSHQTTSESCSCSFFLRMTLPCRHIFFLRMYLGMPVFTTDLVPARFRLTNQSNSVPSDSFTGEGSLVTVATPFRSLSLRTQEGRFRKAKTVCDSIVSYLSILGADEFTEKLQQLQDLVDLWSASGSPSGSNPRHLSGTLVPSPPPIATPDVFPSPSPPPVVASGAPLPSPSPPPVVASGAPLPSPPPVVASGAPLPSPPPVVASGAPLPSPPPVVASGAPLPSPPPVVASGAPLPSLPPVVASGAPLPSPPPVVASGAPLPSPLPVSPVPSHSGASTGISFSRLRLARVKRPRGRPCNTQRFTQKRRRVGPLKFDALSVAEKQDLILKAVCRSFDVHQTSPMCSSDLLHFTHFRDTVLDPSVDISIVRSFFDADSWSYLEDGVATRRCDGLFRCGDCGELDDFAQKMIMCERCLRWFHFSCAGYRSKMRVSVWFCQSCFSC